MERTEDRQQHLRVSMRGSSPAQSVSMSVSYQDICSIYRKECYASEWSVPRTGSNTGEYQGEEVLLLSQSQCLYHNKIFVVFIGKSVMLVNGAYRGQAATLESINERKFSCSVSLNVCIITRYLFYL